LAFLAGASVGDQISLPNGQPRSLSEPETDKKNQEKRAYAEPRDENHFDSDVTGGRNVVVDSRIAVKEPVTIAKKVCASRQVKEEEKGRGDSQSRQSFRIDYCDHMFRFRLLS
jgi:hypothetical protein